jgi:hypothetical protein
MAVSPTYKGRLDFDKVEAINKREVGTRKQMELIHSDHEGVSLTSYTVIESLHEMLFFEFTEVIKQGLRAKKCRLCGRYFILPNRHDADYCGRSYKNKRTCKQSGAKIAYDERTANDQYLKKYQQIYKRYYARCYDGNRPFENYPDSKFYNLSFREWSKIANELRRKYLAGEVSGNAFIDGIEG